MERTASLLSFSSRSSSHASTNRKHEPLLPCAEPVSEKPTIKVRSLLSHCLYRRVLLWALGSILLVSIVVFKSTRLSFPDVVGSHFSYLKTGSTSATTPSSEFSPPDGAVLGQDSSGKTVVVVVKPEDQQNKVDDAQRLDPTTEEDEDEYKDEEAVKLDAEEAAKIEAKEEEALRKMPWLRFKHLNGYYHGLKAIVSKSKHVPEYPNNSGSAPFPKPPLRSDEPTQSPYSPYSPDNTRRTCYLDKSEQIPAPDMFAYDGVPQHMPDAAIGSHNLLGLRDDVCFDRFGRYGPYGYGYNRLQGGLAVGLDTQNSGSEAIWEHSGHINYNMIDWSDAQDRCTESNQHRFLQPDPETEQLVMKEGDEGKKVRTAVIVRLYTGFRWTELSVLNFRAMITELSLKSGGEYTVHFLLHIRDENQPIWSDDLTVQRILDSNVPPEFHGLVTVWSEPQMKLFYPGKFGKPMHNPSGQGIHGVYRSAHMPLQVFAMQHPEYEHFWNWEMDMRYVGNYYELFDRIGQWADSQPRKHLWERNARYYIPSYHGSWENFTSSVKDFTQEQGKQPIFGPVDFPGKKLLRHQQRGESVMPASCAIGRDDARCGVGESADLISLNPLFDVYGSGWVFSNDATGYTGNPPRRCAIVTASRLSRRLVSAMHEEVWRHHHTMFSEMFPPSVALHHGLKAVYAPHPTFLDRAWDPSSIDAAFNGGQHHSTSGAGSPFDLRNEHNHKGTSWYYNSEFAGHLWRRWLGYAQWDGRGQVAGNYDAGKMRGGMEEENKKRSSGRMCLTSMLVHPIKKEHPMEK